eukprot:1157893-Pelagomonas_calceolata.AAC.2
MRAVDRRKELKEKKCVCATDRRKEYKYACCRQKKGAQRVTVGQAQTVIVPRLAAQQEDLVAQHQDITYTGMRI